MPPRSKAPIPHLHEVVDTQVHLNELGLEAGLAAMDAVGVAAVVIDEWWGYDQHGLAKPFRYLPNGAIRSQYRFAEDAVRRYPSRFVYMARVDPADPELTDVVEAIAANPFQVCVRFSPKAALGQIEALEAGKYDDMFTAFQQFDVPLFMWVPGNLGLIRRLLARFPGLRLVLDNAAIYPLAEDATPAVLDTAFDAIATLSDLANVYLKISHLPSLSSQAFPYRDIAERVKRLVSVFGANHVMWASDYTASRWQHSWAEALLYLQGTDVLTTEEKDWVLSLTARTVLAIPRSPTFGLYRQPAMRRASGGSTELADPAGR